jgi:hypothetical protein
LSNVRNSNSIYLDTTGSLNTDPIKIAYIIFTPDSANDQLILKSFDNSGNIKFNVRGATAKDSMTFDFSASPLHFPQGIYVSTLSSNATAVIITTSSGGGNS